MMAPKQKNLDYSKAGVLYSGQAPRRPNAPSGPVHYDSSNHYQVLCQCFGSAWPKVINYCIINIALMIALTVLKHKAGFDMSITGQGHSFAGFLVSFLLVSRINTAISRYTECRDFIGVMYRETRELTQNMIVFSKRYKNNSEQSKEWRSELAYRALLLLRTAVAVVEYTEEQVAAWEVPELSGAELEYLKPNDSWSRHEQTPRDRRNDSMRVPLRMAFLLRETIVSQSERLSKELHVSQENKLLGSVDSFLNGFYGMRKFMTTPVPFPLIQMTRTIVIGYVFTLPFVFLADEKNWLLEHIIVIFLLTYGFIGLELVSIELDDPFGNDENDFDVYAYARLVFEDTYVLVDNTDGQEWADTLRYKMHAAVEQPVNETTGLLSNGGGSGGMV